MMAKDRGADTLGEFAAAMTKHGGRPEQITEIVMDMSPAYIAGAEVERMRRGEEQPVDLADGARQRKGDRGADKKRHRTRSGTPS